MPALGDDVLCRIAASTYTRTADFVCAGDVHVFRDQIGSSFVFSFRGTVPTSWEDWFRDAAAWPDQVHQHPKLGTCHLGFITGAEAALPWLHNQITTTPGLASAGCMLTGHSLGGALAIAAGALLADSALQPVQLTTFGAPRVGFALEAVLAGVPGRRYRHGDDPVPEVPTWPYRHDRALTAIGFPDPNPIKDHEIAGYAAALVPVAVPTTIP